MAPKNDFIGPVLILDNIADDRMHIAAVILTRSDAVPPPLEVDGRSIDPMSLAQFGDLRVWRVRFDVPATQASSYQWNGTTYPLASDLTGDVHLGYVSCNGEEHGDLDRDPVERNVMWGVLSERHRTSPMALLLHGGDQIYADEVTDGHALSEGWPLDVPEDPAGEDLDDMAAYLRSGFAERYAILYGQEPFAWLAARVPSVMQWDDHDICDGWGSLPPEVTASAVGQTLFACAREAALVFQHGCVDGDLPRRFDDAAGAHLAWTVTAPGFRLVAPDLRSQRTFTAVMGDRGWDHMEQATAETGPGHTFLVSSVPLLGPRLSLIERMMRRFPGIQKYEDDLRDQWQSRTHRAAWIRMLRLMQKMAAVPGSQVTALSGEIHLATRAEMALPEGKTLHQLVASGITHRPPKKAWPRILGTLAMLGEDPLPEAPIRILPLPGKKTRYVAERNAMIVSRQGDHWSVVWELEHTGPTPPLTIVDGPRPAT